MAMGMMHCASSMPLHTSSCTFLVRTHLLSLATSGTSSSYILFWQWSSQCCFRGERLSGSWAALLNCFEKLERVISQFPRSFSCWGGIFLYGLVERLSADSLFGFDVIRKWVFGFLHVKLLYFRRIYWQRFSESWEPQGVRFSIIEDGSKVSRVHLVIIFTSTLRTNEVSG